ncbi:MAG TPA: hypothetical protein VIG41_04215 [Micrococcaceae bacterium]|jgi:hypothetical protein
MDQSSDVQVVVRELNDHGREIDSSGPVVPPEEELTSRRGINPFIVVLWILAAGLVLSGIGMIAQARNPLSAGPGYMPLSYVLINVAPYALLAGALITGALLFWHAVQWQRHRGR